MPLSGAPALDRVLARLTDAALGSGAGALLPVLGSRLATALDLHADLKLYRALHGGRKPASVSPPLSQTDAEDLLTLAHALERLQPPTFPAVLRQDQLPPALDEVLHACVAPADVPAQAERAEGDCGFGGNLDFSPLKRYYLIQQRKLASNVAALRQSLRVRLDAGMATAQTLAALDEALEQGLLAHESALLARLPAVLEQLCQRQQQEFAASPDPAAHRRATDELPPVLLACAIELQNLLAAEAELRLLPLRGLLASLSAQSQSSQSQAGSSGSSATLS